MDNKKEIPYSAQRWTDIPKVEVIGKAEPMTDMQRQQYDKDMEKIMKEYGILEKDESL